MVLNINKIEIGNIYNINSQMDREFISNINVDYKTKKWRNSE